MIRRKCCLSQIVNTAWKYMSYGYQLSKKETLRSKWTALPQICPDWDYLSLQLAVTSEKGNNAISKLSLHHGTAQLVALAASQSLSSAWNCRLITG